MKPVNTPIIAGKALKIASAKPVTPKIPSVTIRTLGNGFSAIVDDAQGRSTSVYAADIPGMISKVEALRGPCNFDLSGTPLVKADPEPETAPEPTADEIAESGLDDQQANCDANPTA